MAQTSMYRMESVSYAWKTKIEQYDNGRYYIIITTPDNVEHIIPGETYTREESEARLGIINSSMKAYIYNAANYSAGKLYIPWEQD